MLHMFTYLTGILDQEEKKAWKHIAVLGFVCASMEIFSFTATIYMIPAVFKDHPFAGRIQACAVLCMFIVQILLELYKCRITSRFLYGSSQKLSMKIYELFEKEDLEHHHQKSVMQALTMVRSDTAKSIGMILSCIEVGANLFMIGGYAAILVFISTWIGLLSSVIVIGVTAGIFLWYSVRMEVYGEKCRQYEIRANSQITLGYGIFEEMKMCSDIEPVLRKYYDASREYARLQGEYSYKNDFMKVLMSLWMKAMILAIFAVFFLVETDLAAILPVTAYISVLGRMMPATYHVIGSMNSVRYSKKSYEVLKECLTRYQDLKEAEKKQKGIREKRVTLQKSVSVQNLTFGYPGKETIFENASIDIPAGKTVAVIGVSGIGKTTFLSLVMGLLKPHGGRILYDDYEIVSHTDEEGICKGDLGKIVSYIPQTVYMNGETVRNNVALFEAEERIDDKKAEECLRCAQVWEDVAGMPQGIHTLISERGTTISGGQRQRIALARALYKDFELLIMDEATAALDIETEKAVIDAIRHVRKNKTLLIVTHHKSLADECDMIYKIKNKNLVRIK